MVNTEFLQVKIPEIVAPGDDPQTRESVALVGKLSEGARALAIVGEAGEQVAAQLLVRIKSTLNAVEKRRLELTRPVNALVKELNAIYKLVTDPLERAERDVKAKVARWRAEVEEKNRKAQAEADRLKREAQKNEDVAFESDDPVERELADQQAERQRAKANEALLATPAPSGTVKVGGGASMSSRKVPKWKVVDEKLVPRMFLMVNDKAVNGAVRGGSRAIPGLEIWEEDEVVVRSGGGSQ